MTTYFHLLIANILVLFSVVNPIGNAFVINNNYLINLDSEQRKVIIGKIARCAFFICIGGLFIGKFLLILFGLSVPIIQVAGGAIICRNGWAFFMNDPTPSQTEDETQADDIIAKNRQTQYSYLLNNIFYPLTFPTMIGAGTFSVLLTLAANASAARWGEMILNFSSVVIAIAIICFLVYIIFVNIVVVQKHLGREGNIVVRKMSSFFTICIGLKITVSGLTEIIVLIIEKVKPLI